MMLKEKDLLMINLDTLDKLILDSMCLDYQLKDIYPLLEIPRTTLMEKLRSLRDLFGVKNNTALIYKYSKIEEL